MAGEFLYCTVQDVVDRSNVKDLLSLLSPADDDTLAIDSPKIVQAIEGHIEEASRMLDDAMSNRTDVPLEEIPTSIPPLTVQIARYYIDRRRLGQENRVQGAASVGGAALDILQKIKDGDLPSGVPQTKGLARSVKAAGPPRTTETSPIDLAKF